MGCCQAFASDFKRPMFGIDESPNNKRTLDMDASFNVGRGFLSVVGIIKFVTFVIAVASLVYSFTVTKIPGFYPAYLTPWGVFFAILHLGGSFILTAFYCKGYNPQNAYVLLKITWLLYSVAGVIGCCITILFWGAVFNPDNPDNDMIDKVMTHGGVVLIVILQGTLLDRVPMRMKHLLFSDGVAIIFSAWLAIQNTVMRYNPHDDDDDDAIYDAMKWREKTGMAIAQTVAVVLVAVPLFHIILWSISLPGRRYLSGSGIVGEEAAKAVDEEKPAIQQPEAMSGDV